MATWSTTDLANVTLSGGNLIATGTNSTAAVRSGNGELTGKFYFEATLTTNSGSNTGIGLTTGATTLSTVGNTPVNSAILYRGGNIWLNNANSGTSLGARSNGDIIGIAVDLAADLIWFRVAPSGNWNANGSANPATGVGGLSCSFLSGVLAYPVATFGVVNDVTTANFGATAFSGTVPSGFTSGWIAPTTWSTTDKSTNIVLSGSNLIANRNTTSGAGVRAKDPKRSGKFYIEIKVTAAWTAGTAVGLATINRPIDSVASNGSTNATVIYQGQNGLATYFPDNTSPWNLGARSVNDIIGIAIDLDNSLVWMRVCPAGNWNASASANPATGVGGASVTGLGQGFDVYPCAYINNTTDTITGNFGGSAFSGTVPSGFTSGWDDTVAALSYAVVTQEGVEAWATTSPNVNVTQIGVEAFTLPNPAYNVTQAGQEVWAVGTGAYHLTQVGLEVWGLVSSVNTQYAVTQVGLEVWRSVADAAHGGPMITVVS